MCVRRVYRFAPQRRHGRHKHLPPLPLAPDALHHDDGLLHGISRRRVHNVERPQSTKACPTAHAGAQCGSSASHRTLLVRHRSHAGRQPEVCIRVDLQLQLYLQVEVWVPSLGTPGKTGFARFARFFKNHKNQKKVRFFGGVLACFFLRLIQGAAKKTSAEYMTLSK